MAAGPLLQVRKENCNVFIQKKEELLYLQAVQDFAQGLPAGNGSTLRGLLPQPRPEAPCMGLQESQ